MPALKDTRTEPERAATRTAIAERPLPPLNELGGVLRVHLRRPPLPQVEPQIAPPTPTVNLVPTVTSTPEVSE